MRITFLGYGGNGEDARRSGSRPAGRERESKTSFSGYEGTFPAEAAGAVEIPREQWIAFFDGFSRQHLHWMATIEATTSEGVVAIVEGRPFAGISADHTGGSERIYIQMGETAAEEMTHILYLPLRITFRQTPSGEHEGLEIVSADGRSTFLRFRSRVRPELLDGI